jgi:DNA primase
MIEELLKLARTRDVLKPFEALDVMLLYGICAHVLVEYLGKREIASKIHIPGFRNVLKRGTKLEPLYAKELAEAVNPAFLELRAKHHLGDVQGMLSNAQKKTWRYFVPRKLVEFFYATNRERGQTIERIYFDIDRGINTTVEQAVEVTRVFLEELKTSKLAEFGESILVSWTGNSFHVEMELEEGQPLSFYKEWLTTKEKSNTETKKLVEKVNEKCSVRVLPEHVRADNAITVDPSQTPPGKLNRAPLGCVHVSRENSTDGVSLPVKESWLYSEKATGLTRYTPQMLIREFEQFRNLKRFYIRI